MNKQRDYMFTPLYGKYESKCSFSRTKIFVRWDLLARPHPGFKRPNNTQQLANDS